MNDELAQKKLLLGEWIAGLGSLHEVDQVLRLLLENGYPIAVAHVGNPFFQLPSGVVSLIAEQVSSWKDLHQLRATCGWFRTHAVGWFQRDCEAMRIHGGKSRDLARAGLYAWPLQFQR